MDRESFRMMNKYYTKDEYIQKHIDDVYALMGYGNVFDNYILAYTRDKRRIIDSMNTEKYIESIAKKIDKKALDVLDEVIKESLK